VDANVYPTYALNGGKKLDAFGGRMALAQQYQPRLPLISGKRGRTVYRWPAAKWEIDKA